MPTTSAPYGLIPIQLVGGGTSTAGVRQYKLLSNSSTGFFYGDIVNIGAGVATPVTATPTTTRNGNTPWGIFVGCSYYDTNGQPRYSQYLPANGYTTYNSYGDILLSVMDDPNMVMQVQASGSVANTDIGKNAALTNFSAGSTTTGNSKVQLDQSSINTTNTLGVKIIAIAPGPNNAAGDTYTDVWVRWNQNVHAYNNILGV